MRTCVLLLSLSTFALCTPPPHNRRSLELPVVLAVNRHSGAKDFTEGHGTLKSGKVDGEPAAGWMFYTGSANLIV
jgi:hypothetical protein